MRASRKGQIESIALITAYDQPLPGNLVGHVKVMVADLLTRAEQAERDYSAFIATAEAAHDSLQRSFEAEWKLRLGAETALAQVQAAAFESARKLQVKLLEKDAEIARLREWLRKGGAGWSVAG